MAGVGNTSEALQALQTFALQLVSGGGAGAISKTAVAPIERVKVILQVERGTGSGAVSVAATILRTQGVLAFWRGNGVNVLRIIPNAAIKFSCNDSFKSIMAHGSDPRALPVLSKLLAGSASGVTMTLLTYPLDLARTRVTADMAAKGSNRNYLGLADCLKQTIEIEGIAALYKGLLPSLGSIIPYVGIGFTVYDEIKLVLESRNGAAGGGQGDGCAGLGFAGRLAAGAGSGVFAQSITYPIDTVRRRMQMDGQLGQTRLYTGVIDCMAQVYRRGGVRVFYRGLLINALKATPGAAIQFAAYDLIKVLLIK